MEREKSDKDGNRQVFFFNDEGKLVIQTNNGVIDDGVEKVRLKGFFSCNAKTMGIILNKFKGVNAEIGDKNLYRIKTREYWDMRRNCDILEETSYSVIGLDKDEVEKRLIDIAEQRIQKEVDEKVKTIHDARIALSEQLHKTITNYNKLPWWKRMFKKVEI